MRRSGNAREVLFRVGVILKGLDGVLEIAGGIALWLVSPGLIVRWVGLLTQDEIAKNPNDAVANYLRMACKPLLGFRQAFPRLLPASPWRCQNFRGRGAAQKQIVGLSLGHRRLRRIHRLSDVPLHARWERRADRA